MHQERIKLNDSTIDVVMKLSEGNAGAVTVITQIIALGNAIDPQDLMGGFGAPISLDSFGIYGHRVWMLYKDVCRENLVDTIGVIRGCQMGFVSLATLNHAIDNRGAGLDVAAVMKAVREALPEFGRESEKAEIAAVAH